MDLLVSVIDSLLYSPAESGFEFLGLGLFKRESQDLSRQAARNQFYELLSL
jgi:hypothetical protein